MTKILILGSEGLLGNAIYKFLKAKDDLEVVGAARSVARKSEFLKFDFVSADSLKNFLKNNRADYIINCIANTSQSTTEEKNYFFVNSILPKLLSFYSHCLDYKLIHFSSNGVFSGLRGYYSEDDRPDNEALYSLSKRIGEIKDEINCTTIRTSIIGIRKGSKQSLLDWFQSLEENSVIFGYKNVYWNGMTTLSVAEVIYEIISNNIKLKGLFHLSSADVVSKYELLQYFKELFSKEIKVIPVDEPQINQTLKNSKELENISNSLGSIKEQLIKLKEFYE